MKAFISGYVYLGSPFFLAGKIIGTVSRIYEKNDNDGYSWCAIKTESSHIRNCFILDKNSVIITDDCIEIAKEEHSIWINTRDGLIGAADINDGEQIYLRIRNPEVNHGLQPLSYRVVCNSHQETTSFKVITDIYYNETVDRYLIPIYVSNYSSKLSVLYGTKYNINNLK